MRLRPLLLLIPFALAGPDAPAQDEPEIESRSTEVRLDSGFDLDRGPIDHLGWGTVEDLFVDVGLGAGVSVFSGNLVFSLDPFPRGDSVPGAKLGLTYNHRDPDGARELARGWSWDLGRLLTPGPWGDRILIDADGFRDSFFAAEPPTGEALEEMVEEVVSAWRRSTPPADRRRAGGVGKLRSLLTADPLVFGEMRLRYLGAPDPVDADLPYQSWRRGRRLLQQTDEGTLLQRGDGGTELYGDDGSLLRVEPVGYPVVEPARQAGRLVGVDIDGARQYHISLDSQGRIREMRDASGRRAELVYVGSTLHRVVLPRGRVSFEYDGVGRLTTVRAPGGVVIVDYDPQSGRVRRIAGPSGGADLSNVQTERKRLSVSVRTPDGDPVQCTWDGDDRAWTMRSGDWSRRVEFEPKRSLPVEVEDEFGRTELAWDDAGRILRTERAGRATRWNRQNGVLEAIIEPSGERAGVQAEASGRPTGWIDPEGRTTGLLFDRRGGLRLLRRPGGADEGIKRSAGGALLGRDRPGGADVMLRRNARGYLWSADFPFLGTAGLRFDEVGRVVRFDGAAGVTVELDRRRDGPITEIREGGNSITLTRDDAGRLTGWSGASGASIDRDAAGRVTGVRRGAARWTVDRGNDGVPRRIGTPSGASLSLDFDGALPTRLGRPAGGFLEFAWDDGRVAALEATGTGAVELVRDRAGRVVAVGRGVGRWTLERDRSGLVSSLSDASGGAIVLGRDGAGRVERLVLPLDQRWSFKHDDGGRLREAVGADGAWALLRRPTGLPTTFLDPGRGKASLDWDTRGRIAGVAAPGVGEVSIGYSDAGPSTVGTARLRWDPRGRLLGWSATGGPGGWEYRLGPGGRVREIGPDEDDGRPTLRVEHDAADRPVEFGDTSARWSPQGLVGAARGAREWTWERDRGGLVRSLSGPNGAVAFRRENTGDVRDITVTTGRMETSWSLRRDSSGRVAGATRAGGATWSLRRDSLGRPASWSLLRDEVGIEGLVSWEGLRTRTVQLGLEAPALTIAARWDKRGRPADTDVHRTAVYGPAPFQTPALEGERGAGVDPEDPIGAALLGADPLGEAILGPPVGLRWAGIPLTDGDGAPVLPSPLDSGTALTSVDRLRLTDAAGATVGWVHPLDAELPPHALDPAPADVPRARAGDAAPVAEWWARLATAPEEHARVGAGIGADAAAWLLPRRARFAAAAGLSEEDAPTGVGAFLAPVPGASRQVPVPRAARRLGIVEALVASGELPPGSMGHRGFLAGPADPWQVEIVGAEVLLDLARRWASPSEPPWPGRGVAALSGHGNGLVTQAGRALDRAPPFEVEPALGRLPAGTHDVLPGAAGARVADLWTHPAGARAGALERLSDESTGARGVPAGVADDDALLLALRRLVPTSPSALSGRVAPPVAAEVWRIETPRGVAIHVDRRGMLVSIDALERLHRSYGEAVTAGIGEALATPDAEPPPGLDGMPYLPAPGPLPENRWGLTPTEPRLPLDALGRPTGPHGLD